MKYKAKYSAESDIPTDVKPFYVLKDGEWVFNGSEFEGLDALLNPGLAANRDKILQEKKDAIEANQALQTELDKTKTELTTVQKPGTKVISAEDEKTFTEYKALGTVKDIKDRLDNEVQIKAKLDSYETENQIRGLAKKLNLNEDALVDFKLNSERGKGLKLGTSKRKVKNDKGVEAEEEFPAVILTNNINGKDKEEYKDFKEYATENNFPQYLIDAIFNSTSNDGKKEQPKKTPFSAPSSVKEKTKSDDKDSGSLVKKSLRSFRQENSTRSFPWDKKKEEAEA